MKARLLGQRIKDRRDAQGLTQGQVAAYAGVSVSYLSRLERGLYDSPSVAQLQLIAKALACSLSDLVDAPATDPDLDDPELDLLFHQIKSADLSETDLMYVKETIRTALRIRRERAGEANATP